MRSILPNLLHRGMIQGSSAVEATAVMFRRWTHDEEDVHVSHAGALCSLDADYETLNVQPSVAKYSHEAAFDVSFCSKVCSVIPMQSGRLRLRLLVEHRGHTAFETSLGRYEGLFCRTKREALDCGF